MALPPGRYVVYVAILWIGAIAAVQPALGQAQRSRTAQAPMGSTTGPRPASDTTVGPTEPRFTSYEYDFGSEHGFGASSTVPRPTVTPILVENLRQEADAGSRDSQYFYALLNHYGEGLPVDKRAAAKYFRKAAAQGHPQAATNLGLMYYSGDGAPQDDKLALAWFRRGAEAGNADSQWMLGRMFYDGRGSEIHHAKARKWFLKAADQGNTKGCFYLGMMDEYGLAGTRDFSAAMDWYKKASTADDARAMYHLGLMYLHGRGSEVDYPRAAIWLDMAAKHQHGPASFWLGLMHFNGEGFPVDYKVALTWFKLARDSGDPLVVDQAAEAVEFLTNSLAEAEAQVQGVRNRFDPTHPDFDPEYGQGSGKREPSAAHPSRGFVSHGHPIRPGASSPYRP